MAVQSNSFVVRGATIITMDDARRVLMDGALAVREDRIAWVGPDRDLPAEFAQWDSLDGSSRVLTPGLINGHVHITGDPLTRHYTPDNSNAPDIMEKWVLPRYYGHTPEDENISAQFGALELLKCGTTTFVEAGTLRHLDAVVDGLSQTGIRGRVSGWIEGRSHQGKAQDALDTDTAIRQMEDQAVRYPSGDDRLISAWPILVGHSTNTDAVWQAAKTIADRDKIRFAAHMSPYDSDPQWFLENTGHRPVEHLADLGVLGENLILTHMTHLDDSEIAIYAKSGAHIAFCPFAALKGAFGVAAHGRYVDLLRLGVNFLLATDGYDCDLLGATRLATSLFKDSAQDAAFGSALHGLEMVTCGAARALGLDDQIGSLEVEKKADFLAFDKRHFQWLPLLSPLDQLHWSASSASLLDVWVEGQQVISDRASTMVDEDWLAHEVQTRGEAIIARADLPFARNWTTIN